jgi:hypothetical protein
MANEVALVRQSEMNLFPSTSEWSMMKEQASMLVKTGFLPNAIKTPEQAIAIMLKGRELGMAPMQAFSHIAIIQGKPTISAEGMLALILKAYPSTKITYIQNDDLACIMEVVRPGNAPARFSFSYEDAQKAKLTNKDNWNTYRRAMLRSRCISEMARSVFPDALSGVSYTPEELEAEVVPKKSSNTVSVLPPAKSEQIKKMLGAFSDLYAKQTGEDPGALRYVIEDMLGGKDIESLDEKEIKDLKILYSQLASGKCTWDQIIMPKPKTPIVATLEEEKIFDPTEENDLQNL